MSGRCSGDTKLVFDRCHVRSQTTTLAIQGGGGEIAVFSSVTPNIPDSTAIKLDYASNASFQLLSNSPFTNTVSLDSITVWNTVS